MDNRINIKLYLFTAVICFLIAFAAPAQDVALRSNKGTGVQEKITLHTDRSLYLTGEKIWFRADYLLNEQYAKNQLSNILYVELLNMDQNPAVQKKFEIRRGTAHGMIQIPGEVRSGHYLLRAYTRFQRNFSSQAYEYLPLEIINPGNPPKRLNRPDSQLITIYPEGGKLIEGIPTNVVFKIKGDLLRRADSVIITDQKDSVWAVPDMLENGLGMAGIIADDSIKLMLKIVLTTGDTVIKHFPDILQQGISVRSNSEENYIRYHIRDNDDQNDPGQKLEIWSEEGRRLNSIMVHNGSLQIEKADLQPGINYLALRRNDGSIDHITPFINPYAYQKIQIEGLSGKYTSRELVDLSVEMDATGAGNFTGSVAVIRKGTMGNRGDALLLPQHVIANPLLIEGYLHNYPVTGPLMAKQLNMVSILLEKQVNQTAFKKKLKTWPLGDLDFLPEVRGVSLSGLVRNTKTGQPVEGARVYASVLFNNPQIHIFNTGKDGGFTFSLNDLDGMQDVYISPAVENDKGRQEVLIDNDFSSKHPGLNPSLLKLRLDERDFLEELIVNRKVRENFYFNGITPETKDQQQVPLFGEERLTVKMEDYIDLKDMKEVFKEIVPYMKTITHRGETELQVISENNYILPGKPLMLVDNVPIFDAGEIMNMHPSQIDKIEVINQAYQVGDHSVNGIITITTKTENFGGVKAPEAAIFAEYQAIAEKSEYRPMDYDRHEAKASVPEFRTVLYWNHELTIDGEKAEISFYTSDRRGEYEIIVRGMTNDGQYVYGKESFVVE